MKLFFLTCIPLLLVSCAPRVMRDEAISTAYRYTQVQWLPDARHVRQGPDSLGILVRTPDRSLGQRGWWQPGELATGMP